MFVHTTNTITSRRNWQIVEARKLQQRKHRQRQKRFLVEGIQLLQVALDAGLQPVEVFICMRQCENAELQPLLTRIRETHADFVLVLPHIMATLSDRHNPETIISAFTSFETPFELVDPNNRELLLIVDRPQSPPNLGMIFRTADAVGAAAVILIQPCVDPFHPISIRTSLGTLFNVPFIQTSDIAGIFTWLDQLGFRPVGTDPSSGVWSEEIWKGKVALVLGSDVHGMSYELRHRVKDWVRLPMMGKVESLSSAVAGSILMYDWLRANGVS